MHFTPPPTHVPVVFERVLFEPSALSKRRAAEFIFHFWSTLSCISCARCGAAEFHSLLGVLFMHQDKGFTLTALVKKLPRSLSLSVVFHARNAKYNDDGMNDVRASQSGASCRSLCNIKLGVIIPARTYPV
jgi:hypothetical protein